MSGFGERLRNLRQASGLSQTQLAGEDLSPSYISLIESGKRQPSPDVVRALASRLGCAPEELEGETALSRGLVELEIAYARLALAHGEAASARDRLVTLLGSGAPLDRVTRDDVLYLLAQAHEKTNDLTRAATVLLPVYERCLTQDSHLPVATVSISLCGYYVDSGDLHAAVRVAEAGLRAVANQRLVGTDEHLRLAATLMSAYYELGDLLHCAAWAEQLMELAEGHGSAAGQAAVYWNAAYVAEAQGRADEAVRLCDQALALMTERGTVRDLPRLRMNAAWFILRADPTRAAEAAAILDQSLEDLQDLGSPVDLAIWESTRSLADLLLGAPDRAEQLARQALLHLSAYPGVESARALICLGDALVAQGQRAEADEHYEAAGHALEEAPPSRQVASVWREIADRLALSREVDRALAAYRRALDSGGIRSNLAPAQAAFGAARTCPPPQEPPATGTGTTPAQERPATPSQRSSTDHTTAPSQRSSTDHTTTPTRGRQ